MVGSKNVEKEQKPQSLLTRKSLALSLAAPRVPPHGTAHRALLTGVDSTDLPWTPHHHHDNDYAQPHDHHKQSLRRRIVRFLQKAAAIRKNPLPHPHLPMDPELLEHITRFLGVWLPLPLQHWIRDSGTLRAIADHSMAYALPLLTLASPSSMRQFQSLTESCQTLRYGPHPMQLVDMFFPERKQPRGLVFFVHGGGWGMGNPWLYRLVAVPFLEIDLAVAIVGYRTYPCGTVQDQILDLELASSELAQFYPQLCQEPTELGVTVMGHSSGAHITLLMLSNWTRRKMELIEESIKLGGVGPDPDILLPKPHMRVDLFVGISGPYNISHHFDYEASRGMEEISPLKATFYFTREEMLKHSPALRIVECMSHWSNECETRALDNILPRILFVHGIEDDIVPFTSSAEAASLLRSCGVSKLEEIYLASTIHNDCVVQLMIGGQVRDALVEWIENIPKTRQIEAAQRLVVRSRL